MTHQFSRLATRDALDPPHRSYVERGGELVTRQPFDVYGTRLHLFPVEADLERLTWLCNRSFGIPTAGAECYVPVGGFVLLSFAEVTALRSSDPPDRALGVGTEREAGVWLPLLDRRRDRVVWTMPYLFVSEAGPLVGGREIFGYPKQLGRVRFTPGDANPTAFEVAARCIRRFAPESRVGWHRVMRVSRSGTEPAGPPRRSWNQPADGIAEIEPAGPPRNGLLEAEGRAHAALLLLRDLATGRLPVVLLKQFRDAADPTRACYQAIIEVEQRVVDFRGGGPLGGGWQVEVADLDGEPLIRELGLAATTTAEHGYWLDFDFRIRAGRPLWEARLREAGQREARQWEARQWEARR